jgi:hypothetical protein
MEIFLRAGAVDFRLSFPNGILARRGAAGRLGNDGWGLFCWSHVFVMAADSRRYTLIRKGASGLLDFQAYRAH